MHPQLFLLKIQVILVNHMPQVHFSSAVFNGFALSLWTFSFGLLLALSTSKAKVQRPRCRVILTAKSVNPL